MLLHFLFTLIVFMISSSYGHSESVVYGMSPVSFQDEEIIDGILVFSSGEQVMVYLYGSNLVEDVRIGLSKNKDCDYVEAAVLEIVNGSNGHVAVMSLTTPKTEERFLKHVHFYLCLKHEGNAAWELQSATDKAYMYIYDPLFHLTNTYLFIIIFMCFLLSSLMSGLNIGLFTLDEHELHLLQQAGSEQEKKYAKKITPIRKNGNFLLCSILITCTLCNSAATVLIERLVTDWLTVAISTIVIVLLCEIVPQSVCNKFPLAIGAKTVLVTKTCMILTFPLSYPLSKLLNLFLGKELQSSYSRDRLRELLKMTSLPVQEEKIISGALDLDRKSVSEVMTMLDDIFKLPITAELDFDTISSIVNSGYSRIPIYVGEKSNIEYVLLTKDLALINPDHKIPVKTLLNSSKYACQYIPMKTTLDSVLGMFKDSRRHMVFVVDPSVISQDERRNVVGLVTFEDVMEEILQMEINDETDTFLDNRSKQLLPGDRSPVSLVHLLSQYTKKPLAPSENLKLAAFHFLSGVDLFSYKYISTSVLMNLLNMDIYCSTPGQSLAQDNIYIRGVPANFFVMVLEGQVEVKIGKEEFKFPSGSFRTFGEGALQAGLSSDYIPDYTVQAVTKTLYLKINRALYEAAILATRYEMFKEVPEINNKSSLFKYYKQLVPSETNIIESRTGSVVKSSRTNTSLEKASDS